GVGADRGRARGQGRAARPGGQRGGGVAVDEAAVAQADRRDRPAVGHRVAAGGDRQGGRADGRDAGVVADRVVGVDRARAGRGVGADRGRARGQGRAGRPGGQRGGGV